MKSNFQIKKWITKVIESSLNLDHLKTSKNLVLNFEKQMARDGYDKMLMMPFLVDLNHRLENKERELILDQTKTNKK